jgi:preprotein translocase subunit SecA
VISACEKIGKLGELNADHLRVIVESKLISEDEKDSIKSIEELKERALARVEGYGALPQLAAQMVSLLDFMWMNHLEDIESLTESVRIRAYAQRDPLVEYRRESKELFEAMNGRLDEWVFLNAWKFEETVLGAEVQLGGKPNDHIVEQKQVNPYASDKVGRNDDCPCGSGKKYKKCHGA